MNIQVMVISLNTSLNSNYTLKPRNVTNRQIHTNAYVVKKPLKTYRPCLFIFVEIFIFSKITYWIY